MKGGGEWPEFDCALCPQHGYGSLAETPDLDKGDPLCKYHDKFLAGAFPVEEMGGKCATCQNFYDRTYVRTRAYSGFAGARYCAHCIDLQNTTAGRGGGRGGQNEERPRNQPKPSIMHGVPGICVYCGTSARPRYQWAGQSITACGWSHAGMFMDAVMDLRVGPEGSEAEKRELAEGEEYVRKSLGIT